MRKLIDNKVFKASFIPFNSTLKRLVLLILSKKVFKVLLREKLLLIHSTNIDFIMWC